MFANHNAGSNWGPFVVCVIRVFLSSLSLLVKLGFPDWDVESWASNFFESILGLLKKFVFSSTFVSLFIWLSCGFDLIYLFVTRTGASLIYFCILFETRLH
jgi:hypothetical protein